MEMSFYSTSLYNTERPIGSVYCTTDSIARTLSSQAVSVGGLSAPWSTAPKALYTMAYQPAEAATVGTSLMAYASGRPDKPPVGGMTPMGDSVLPLAVCVLVYGVWKLRRVFHFANK